MWVSVARVLDESSSARATPPGQRVWPACWPIHPILGYWESKVHKNF